MTEKPLHWSPDQEPDNLYKAKREQTSGEYTYDWDELTDRYVRWITVNDRPVCISMEEDRPDEYERALQMIGREADMREYLQECARRNATNAQMTRQEKYEQMKKYECDIYLLLRVQGRALLRYDTTGRKRVKCTGKIPLKAEPNSYIEKRASNGNVVQCRFYDAESNAEQDFDFHHADGNLTHVFPHSHVFFGSIRTSALPFIYKDDQVLYRKAEELTEMDELNDDDKRLLWILRGPIWLKMNNITYDSIEAFETPPFKSTGMTIRDIQCLLSYGREFTIEYNGCSAFFGMACTGIYIIDSTYEGKNYFYQTGLVDDIPDEAYIGPFMLRDVIDKCVLVDI